MGRVAEVVGDGRVSTHCSTGRRFRSVRYRRGWSTTRRAQSASGLRHRRAECRKTVRPTADGYGRVHRAMSNVRQGVDVRLLARWLGAAGAKAGLLASRQCTVEALAEIAKQSGIDVGKRVTRRELIDELVRVASKRIDKSIDELFEMNHDELVRYFDEREVETAELLDLLKELELSPDRKTRKNVIEFAARELAETGRFRRIAGNQRRVASGAALRQPELHHGARTSSRTG